MARYRKPKGSQIVGVNRTYYCESPEDDNLLGIFPSEELGGNINYVVTAYVAPIIPARLYGPPEDCYAEEGGEVEDEVIRLLGVSDESEEIEVVLNAEQQARVMEFLERQLIGSNRRAWEQEAHKQAREDSEYDPPDWYDDLRHGNY